MKPNVLFVIADQWRYQAFGSSADPNVRTPHLDRFAAGSFRFTHAISGCPVCSPYRASLMTGRFPLSHGVFVNDVPLDTTTTCLAEAFSSAGYTTGYIGKWHIDGRGRECYIPARRRRGFQHWQAVECSHQYFHSPFFQNADRSKRFWSGYDAFAQTQAAGEFFRRQSGQKPFLLMISWGAPHDPYDAAPAKYKALYSPESLTLRPNVPSQISDSVRRDLVGYYGHCSALDECFGQLLQTLGEQQLDRNTIIVFTSDHGDMLGSQGLWLKQKPWDESIRVPLLLRIPNATSPRSIPDVMIDGPDLMPTLLGLCGLSIPERVEGSDYSGFLLKGNPAPGGKEALIASYHPFGGWRAGKDGGIYGFTGREYRGIRTPRYTYVRSLVGPWLLYDNLVDPYQMQNLVNVPDWHKVQDTLEQRLQELLSNRNDQFRPGMEYIRGWGYPVDEDGTVPYTP